GAATTVTLAVGDTTAAAAVAAIQATAGTGVNATVDWQGHLMITSQTLGAHTLAIGGTHTYARLNGTYTGTSRSDNSVKDALNAAFSASSTLQKAGLQATVDGSHKLTIASNNGTAFRVNTSTTSALGDIGFGHTGAAFGGLTVNNSNVSVLDA